MHNSTMGSLDLHHGDCYQLHVGEHVKLVFRSPVFMLEAPDGDLQPVLSLEQYSYWSQANKT